MLKQEIILNNGNSIPVIGYGTWRISESEAEDAILNAISAGYRHIDTAEVYNNQKGIGNALEKSEVPRERLCVTSKVWNNSQGYESTIKSVKNTLRELKTDYLDLFLIHWPIPFAYKDQWVTKNRETYKAMEELHKDGVLRSIGVSNFKVKHLVPLMEYCSVKPAVNQIEVNPGKDITEIEQYCIENNITIEGWAPLAVGRIFAVDKILQIAGKHNKTAAQVCLKWCLQRGIIPLVKSLNSERMKENLDIFDFELDKGDMFALTNLSDKIESGLDPDNFTR